MGGMERGEGRGGEGGKGWTVNAEEFGSGSRQTLSHNDCHNQIVPTSTVSPGSCSNREFK